MKNILEILITVLYIFLAHAYAMEIAAKQYHMRKYIMPYMIEVMEVVKWSTIKYWLQMSILICGGTLATIAVWRINYYRDVGPNLIPMQTVDDMPKKWNEMILRDATEVSSATMSSLASPLTNAGGTNVLGAPMDVADRTELAHVADRTEIVQYTVLTVSDASTNPPEGERSVSEAPTVAAHSTEKVQDRVVTILDTTMNHLHLKSIQLSCKHLKMQLIAMKYFWQ